MKLKRSLSYAINCIIIFQNTRKQFVNHFDCALRFTATLLVCVYLCICAIDGQIFCFGSIFSIKKASSNGMDTNFTVKLISIKRKLMTTATLKTETDTRKMRDGRKRLVCMCGLLVGDAHAFLLCAFDFYLSAKTSLFIVYMLQKFYFE